MFKQSFTRRFLFLFALFIFSAGITVAQTTEFIYQGSLKDGANPATGNYDFEFLLFDAMVDGSQIGSTLSRNGVAVSNGVFDVKLDFGNQFPGANRFLEIHVRQTGGGAFTILTPRQLVTSVPYSVQSLNAANATNATQLNGQAASFYQNAANLSSGTLADARLSSNIALLNNAQTFTGAKTFSAAPSFTAAGAPFSVTSTTLVTNLNADRLDGLDSTAFLQSIPNPLTLTGTSATHTIRGENSSTGVFARGVHGAATGASGATIGVLGESASTSGTGVAGLASSNTGTTTGVSGQSDSTSGRGVFGQATAATGTTYGGRFLSASTSGQGVFGWATAASGVTYGGIFQNDSTAGRGVSGSATAATGTTYGGKFQSDSTSGRGVFGQATAATGTTYGGRFLSDSTSGQGVYGLATASSGVTYGGNFRSDSPAGRGVFGWATADGLFTVESSYGVYGQSDSVRGYGVFGLATASDGVAGVYGLATGSAGGTKGGRFVSESTSGTGVYGYATASSGTTYGVYGFKSSLPEGYAVFANGDMGASGVKPFRIDHPDDPANKYLLHYAAESPEVINFYRGTVTLDGAGEAVVELPYYFAKINKRPSYQLTAVGAPMPMLHVAVKISESALSVGAKAEPGEAAPFCSFRIAGGAPGGEVSWEVKALRNDRWVQQHGGPVELDKQQAEKGKYQHPELYGQPAEKGMDFDAARKRPEPARP